MTGDLSVPACDAVRGPGRGRSCALGRQHAVILKLANLLFHSHPAVLTFLIVTNQSDLSFGSRAHHLPSLVLLDQ